MPKCRVAESRKVLSFSGKFYHRRTHVKRGDLGPDEELPTEDFEGSTLPHSDLPLFRDILKHAAQNEDLGDDEDDDILPTDEVSSVPWLQPDDLEQLGSNEILSAHHRQQIYDSNVAKWYLQVRVWVQRCGLTGSDKFSTCNTEGCDHPCAYGSTACDLHLPNLMAIQHQIEAQKTNLQPARKVFNSRLHHEWHCPSTYHQVRRFITEISQGKRPGSDLIVLDNEFSVATKQLWEFAIIEQVSGKTLVNTTIKHDNGLEHDGPAAARGSTFKSTASRVQASKIFSQSRMNIEHRDVHQVAAKLKDIGMRPKTLVLTWHLHAADLQILRNFLESAGYYVGKKQFPMRLDMLFPLMFPNHRLVGLNHEALIDCQQTRLICLAFKQLCRPVEERQTQWQPAIDKKPLQASIRDWLIKRSPVKEAKVGSDPEASP
ncbi:hypothetical protein ACHAO4_005655 [Trichoderma viride]